MDYSVRDSSVWQDPSAFAAVDRKDNSLRIGIVREEKVLKDDSTRYVVEVMMNSKQVPISCVLLTRFGGAYNYEEYRIRPWLQFSSPGALPPMTAGQYNLRSGDVVLVGLLDGQAREGVILGGIRHPARDERTEKGKIAYVSVFNGIETQIRDDGSYKVLFKGKPINEKLLDVPTGTPVMAPVYNPLVSGSYFGFDSKGSYVATDGKQYLKITKNLVSGSIILVSGKNRIDLGGNPALGTMGLKTDTLVMEALKTSVTSKLTYSLETLGLSLKGFQIAIGNDQFELFDGLVKLIDAMGTLIVTSPVGTCTPLMAAPTWATSVLPIKIQLMAIKGSLKAPASFSPSGSDDPDIGDDIE